MDEGGLADHLARGQLLDDFAPETQGLGDDILIGLVRRLLLPAAERNQQEQAQARHQIPFHGFLSHRSAPWGSDHR
jgi:hypothetical protein